MTVHPPNRFGGWCPSCHHWVASGAGFLTGRDEARGRWLVSCAACHEAESVPPPPPPKPPPRADDSTDDRARREEQARDRARRDAEYEDLRRAFEAFFGESGRRGYAPPCFGVLGLTPPVTAEAIRSRFRAMCMEAHPDHGGDAARFVRIKEARDQALALVASGRSRGR